MKKGFPTMPIILLVIAIIWLANDMRWISVNIPWIPVVLIVISIGWILNKYI